MFGGRLVKTVGFPWLMRTVGIVNVSYCCLLVFLSKVADDGTDKVHGKIHGLRNSQGTFDNSRLVFLFHRQ